MERVAAIVDYGEVAILDFDMQCAIRRQRPDQGSFADARHTYDPDLERAFTFQPFLGANKWECHHATSRNRSNTSGFHRIW